MRTASLAHWCAALGVARHCGVMVRWTDKGDAEFSPRPAAPDPSAIILPTESVAPLLVRRGRRDLIAGAARALDLLRSTDSVSTTAEWDWLLDGEQSAIIPSARKLNGSFDQYSLATLWPATADAPTGAGTWAICAWLPVLAVLGAACLDGGRQRWERRRSMHPDQANTFVAIRPQSWVSHDDIAQWYRLAVGARSYELRPIAGHLMSYVP